MTPATKEWMGGIVVTTKGEAAWAFTPERLIPVAKKAWAARWANSFRGMTVAPRIQNDIL
jgi:acyl carrier protein phosphodiesterase